MALPQAVERIYQAKIRPREKAIPLLIADADDLHRIAAMITPAAQALMARFWPGGLTLVVTAQGHISPLITAGMGTVAVRLPDHPVPRTLARSLGVPLAATSANLSGQPSPRTAQEAAQHLATSVDLILDGGPCPGGVESTVVDTTGPTIRILREGAIPSLAIWQALGSEHPQP